MSGKRSRTKGHNYERAIRKEMIELGYKDCQTARYASREADNNGIDLVNTGQYNIQCKAVEKGLNYLETLAAMPQDEKINVIFHKRKRKEIAIMTKEDFYKLIPNGKK